MSTPRHTKEQPLTSMPISDVEKLILKKLKPLIDAKTITKVRSFEIRSFYQMRHDKHCETKCIQIEILHGRYGSTYFYVNDQRKVTKESFGLGFEKNRWYQDAFARFVESCLASKE